MEDVLSIEEARAAYAVGLRRSAAGRSRGGVHRYGWTPRGDDQRRVDAESAVAEALVAKLLGREWLSSGVVPDSYEDGDVDGGVQVRWTSRVDGCLIVHPEDPDEHAFVLVVGNAPQQVVPGWIPGAEAKMERYWRDGVRHPAYFVPQRCLLEIARLRDR